MSFRLTEEDRPPQRIQRRRSKGWRMPPNAVYVGRPTKFGDPYLISRPPPLWPKNDPWGAEEAARCYELMLAGGWRLHKNPGFEIVEAAMVELEGKDLACWCPLDQPCHADILLKYANAVVLPGGEVVV